VYFSTNLTAFMLIVARSMKLSTAKLCVVCLSGVIVINYGNKRFFPKLCLATYFVTALAGTNYYNYFRTLCIKC
jgi:hypothetical protein